MSLNSINQFKYGLFNILAILVLLLCEPVFAKSIIAPENKFLKDAQLVPAKLRLEGDSIRFTINGSIPIESALSPKNPSVSLLFNSEQNKLELGPIELKKNVSRYEYNKSFSLKYESWMAGAVLELFFFQGKKEGQKYYEKQILAKGVIAPQLMVKLGEVYPDEPIPVVGMYLISGALDKDLVRKEEFAILFDPGSSTYKPSEANQATLEKLKIFLGSNPDIQALKVTGIQSPEVAEGKGSALGLARAESVNKVLRDRVGSLSESNGRNGDDPWWVRRPGRS